MTALGRGLPLGGLRCESRAERPVQIGQQVGFHSQAYG
jgi:hypothetical protein